MPHRDSVITRTCARAARGVRRRAYSQTAKKVTSSGAPKVLCMLVNQPLFWVSGYDWAMVVAALSVLTPPDTTFVPVGQSTRRLM
jgi:hypothetical protein